MNGPRTKSFEDVDLSAFNAEERQMAERLLNPPPRPVPPSEDLDKETQERLIQFFEETA